MPKIPLGIAGYTRNAAFQPEVILKNLIVEKDDSGASMDEHVRIQRPGLANYQTVMTGTAVRGLFQSSGVADSLPVAVIGDKLIQFNGTTTTVLGTVVDDGDKVEFAGAGDRLGIVSGGMFYIFDGTLQTIALPDDVEATCLTGTIGYFIIGTATGSWYWLVPGQVEVDALDFATAEVQPDNLIGLATIRDDVFMFGTETVECWQPSGDADAILTPSRGRTFDKGCLSRNSIACFDNSVVWVGNDGVVYLADNVPLRVSTTGIEERIRNRTGSVSAFTYTYDGHYVYVLRIDGIGTFAYDRMSQGWSEFTSADDGFWRAGTSCNLDGGIVLCGDSQSGKVFKLDATISTDDGEVFERAVSGAAPFNNGRIRNDRFEVVVGCDVDTTFNLRWRDGLNDWSTARSMSASAGTSLLATHRLGAAKQPVRTFEISCNEAAVIRISGSTANEGRAT